MLHVCDGLEKEIILNVHEGTFNLAFCHHSFPCRYHLLHSCHLVGSYYIYHVDALQLNYNLGPLDNIINSLSPNEVNVRTIIKNWTLWNKFQWNLNQDRIIFTQENDIEYVVGSMVAILPRPQSINCRRPWRRRNRKENRARVLGQQIGRENSRE